MVISMGQRVLRLCLENGHVELSLFSMRRRHCYVSISNLILYTWDLIWVDSRNSIWLYLYLCEVNCEPASHHRLYVPSKSVIFSFVLPRVDKRALFSKCWTAYILCWNAEFYVEQHGTCVIIQEVRYLL